MRKGQRIYSSSKLNTTGVNYSYSKMKELEFRRSLWTEFGQESLKSIENIIRQIRLNR